MKMKIKFLLIIFLCGIAIHSEAINVSVSTTQFHSEDKAYIEIYSRVISNSVEYITVDSSNQIIQSSVEYTLVFKKNDTIVIADKYRLDSPLSSEPKDYFDLRRYGLSDGSYSLNLFYVDLNNVSDTLFYTENIEVITDPDEILLSDVLLMHDVQQTNEKYNYEKAGFFYEPLCFDLISEEQNVLYLYLEMYNYEEVLEEDFYIKYYPIDLDATTLDNQIKPAYKKLTPSNCASVLLKYDCTDLQSGNYEMFIEVHKKDKTLVAKTEKTFSVIHPMVDYEVLYESDKHFETSFAQFLDRDALDYSLKAIFPRVGNNKTEILNQIISSKDLKPKRYFLYNYWRNFSNNPKVIYDQYMEVVRAIDLRYANNVGHGFESDRGYYFLKYGRPNNIIAVEDEPSAPPYEIWIYNYMPETQETNVRFLFYNPSLVANDFKLLHSTCRGEINNPRWEVDLYIDDTQGQNNNYLDARTTEDNFNRNARRYFTNQ